MPFVNFYHNVKRKLDIPALLYIVCILLLWGSALAVGLQLELEYNNTVQMIHTENDNLAKVFGEHLRLSIAGVDDRLVLLQEEVERQKGADPRFVFERLAAKHQGTHMIIADPAGNLIGSTAKMHPDINIADREYFFAHRQLALTQLYIDRSVIDRILGIATIPISHRINNPDGSFGGVVAGLIPVDYFAAFYRKMEHSDLKNVAVLGMDGHTRLQISGPASAVLDIDSRKDRFLSLLQKNVSNVSNVSNVFNDEYTSAGERRFVSYCRLEKYPLLVVVDSSGEQMLGNYNHHRNWYLLALLSFNAVAIWSGRQLVGKINRLVQTRRELAISEERYRTIIGSINDGVYVLDAETGNVVDVNPKGCELYGLTREELTSTGINGMRKGESPYSPVEAKQWFLRAAAGETLCYDWKIPHKAGYTTWVEIGLKQMMIGSEKRVVAVARDISVHKMQEAQIRRIAYSDTLTGMPNRAFLKEILNSELAKASCSDTVGMVLFIDMDGLKMVNDHFGHSYGDQVIKIAGEYIASIAGEGAVIARIGGDEFVVVLPSQSDSTAISVLAKNMIKQLSRDYKIGESNVYMSASIGIAFYPRNATTVEDILKKADLAMYAAKAAGGNTWRFYDDSMEKDNREKLLLKHALRSAIDKGELLLHYQPIVPSEEGGSLSFEALLRWTSPELGTVPPSRFIPLAEQSETIRNIGSWVLEEATQFIRKLSDMGNSSVRVWVNVSPRQLVAEDFVAFVQSTIEKAGISPWQLGIEITENALIDSLADSIGKLSALRRLGVCLAIDDFGSGYSSLTYLRNLPVHEIKIDKSFINEIEQDEVQLRLVQCIIDLAHALKLVIVAEGVENQIQLERLIQQKCDYIQGYIFSRPLPENEAIHFLHMHNRKIDCIGQRKRSNCG